MTRIANEDKKKTRWQHTHELYISINKRKKLAGKVHRTQNKNKLPSCILCVWLKLWSMYGIYIYRTLYFFLNSCTCLYAEQRVWQNRWNDTLRSHSQFTVAVVVLVIFLVLLLFSFLCHFCLFGNCCFAYTRSDSIHTHSFL